MDLETIASRLVIPREVKFSNYTLISPPHRILSVKSDDIFFVSPALFLWIAAGIQQLNGISLSPKYIKLVDSLVCKIPVVDFKQSDKNHSDLLMISNLDFNLNYKSVQMVETEVNFLKSFILKANNFFTGEHYSE